MVDALRWSVVFWALVVGLVVWAARDLTGRGETRSVGPPEWTGLANVVADAPLSSGDHLAPHLVARLDPCDCPSRGVLEVKLEPASRGEGTG